MGGTPFTLLCHSTLAINTALPAGLSHSTLSVHMGVGLVGDRLCVCVCVCVCLCVSVYFFVWVCVGCESDAGDVTKKEQNNDEMRPSINIGPHSHVSKCILVYYNVYYQVSKQWLLVYYYASRKNLLTFCILHVKIKAWLGPYQLCSNRLSQPISRSWSTAGS